MHASALYVGQFILRHQLFGLLILSWQHCLKVNSVLHRSSRITQPQPWMSYDVMQTPSQTQPNSQSHLKAHFVRLSRPLSMKLHSLLPIILRFA